MAGTPEHENLLERLDRMDHAITAQALASLLGLSPITIYKLAARGDLPSLRIATCVRFDPRQVARYLRGER
ncbi:MAG: helix-turn-helix domain-containing protein [Acidobacteriia bacterium]|nr:helix-turn-helix domain-containing protein [Terriglobia bacterium]